MSNLTQTSYLTKFLDIEHSLLEWCYLDEFWMERDFSNESQIIDILKFLMVLDEVRNADCDLWFPECRYAESIPYAVPFDFKQLQLAGKIFLGKDYTPIDFQNFYEIRNALKSFNRHNKFVVRKNLGDFRGFKKSRNTWRYPKSNNKVLLSSPEDLRDIFGSLCLALNTHHNNDMTFFGFLYDSVKRNLFKRNEPVIYLVSSFLSRFDIHKPYYNVDNLPRDYIPSIELEIRRVMKLSTIA